MTLKLRPYYIFCAPFNGYGPEALDSFYSETKAKGENLGKR